MQPQFGLPPFLLNDAKKHLSFGVAKINVVASDCASTEGVSKSISSETVSPNRPKANSKRRLQPFPSNRASLSSASLTIPKPVNVTIPSKLKTTRIGSPLLFHLLNNSRPRLSSSGVMFLLASRQFGLEEATYLADRFHWKYQRALRMLVAAMNSQCELIPKKIDSPKDFT